MMRQHEGGQDERVGGNTPLLDLDGELLDAPVLGHSSANDSLLGVGGRLPSFDGEHTLLCSVLIHAPDKVPGCLLTEAILDQWCIHSRGRHCTAALLLRADQEAF